MSFENFTSVGPGKTLAYLRNDLRKATQSFFLVGPWIDTYLAEQIALLAPESLTARVLIRPQSQVEEDLWQEMVAAVSRLSQHWKVLEVRTLERLHAKCLLIDDIFYLGSTNWYRYSLETSLEICIRGQTSQVQGLLNQVDQLWEQAVPFTAQKNTSASPQKTKSAVSHIETKGVTQELLDPIAAEVLRRNPKAFVLGKKKPGRS